MRQIPILKASKTDSPSRMKNSETSIRHRENSNRHSNISRSKPTYFKNSMRQIPILKASKTDSPSRMKNSETSIRHRENSNRHSNISSEEPSWGKNSMRQIPILKASKTGRILNSEYEKSNISGKIRTGTPIFREANQTYFKN